MAGVCAAAVGRHHSHTAAAGVLLAAVVTQAGDEPDRPGQQRDGHDRDGDSASNHGRHAVSPFVDGDVLASVGAGGDELDMPELLVMDVHSVFQADLADRLPPLQLRSAAGVGAGPFLGGGVPAVVAGVGGGGGGVSEGQAAIEGAPCGGGGTPGGTRNEVELGGV